MTFDALPDPWWPYLFIFLAGVVPTEAWRWIGVLASGRLNEDAPTFALVRAIATALVAAVISRLILFPDGALAEVPLWARLGSAIIGFAAMEWTGRRIWVGILTGEVLLLAAIALF